MERFRILFSGSGGQGVITASILIAEAAVLLEGLNAVQSQVYGPEARGGATRADVIVSDSPILFPKVNQPNVLVLSQRIKQPGSHDDARAGHRRFGPSQIEPHSSRGLASVRRGEARLVAPTGSCVPDRALLVAALPIAHDVAPLSPRPIGRRQGGRAQE